MSDSDTRVKEWLMGEVDKLKSESQEQDWQTLREAINDRALLSVSHDVFTMHMIFIHLQLLMACVVKTCSGGLSEMMSNPERYKQHMDALTEPIQRMVCCYENGKNVASAYNSAFGSSATKAGAAMICALQKKTLSTAMSSSAVQFLEQHLVATYAAYREAVERAYGLGELAAKTNLLAGGSIVGTHVASTGQGCVLCGAVCAVSAWAVMQLLHAIYAS